MNWNDLHLVASLFNLSPGDLLIITSIIVLLFGTKKLPELFRRDRPFGDTFRDLATMLLMVGIAMWAIIIANRL